MKNLIEKVGTSVKNDVKSQSYHFDIIYICSLEFQYFKFVINKHLNLVFVVNKRTKILKINYFSLFPDLKLY